MNSRWFAPENVVRGLTNGSTRDARSAIQRTWT